MTKAELQERVEQLSQDVVDLSEGFTNVVKLLRQAEKRTLLGRAFLHSSVLG